jgi:hypothetical protein
MARMLDIWDAICESDFMKEKNEGILIKCTILDWWSGSSGRVPA